MKWLYKILFYFQEYYVSTAELPADNFFNVIKTGDFKYLLKKGRKVYGNLSAVWNSIYIEFLQKTKGQEWAAQWQISSKIERLRYKYFVIMTSCICLLSQYNEQFEKNLNELGYKIDIKDITGSVEKIMLQAKNILSLIEIEKKSLKSEFKNDKTIDEMLAEFDKALGFHLPLADITVDRFIGYKKTLENGTGKTK